MDENKILLVDDEDGLRRVLAISLEDSGYRVLPAKDGTEALEIFLRDKPAIVLTDIKMPGMDGIELLRRIKAEKPEAEVIMITGHGDMDLAIKSLEHEATYFITKPIEEDELEAALTRARKRIEERREQRRYRRKVERMLTDMADAGDDDPAQGDRAPGLAASERREVERIGARLKICLLGLESAIARGDMADLQRMKDALEEIAGRLAAMGKGGSDKPNPSP